MKYVIIVISSLQKGGEAMAQKMSDSYKEALKQKELDSFRRQAAQLVRKNPRHRVISARKASEEETLAERQKRLDLAEREVNYRQRALIDAERAAKDNAAGFVATAMLVVFFLLAAAGVAMLLMGKSRVSGVSMLLASLVFLVVSVSAQVAAINTERHVSECLDELVKAQRRANSLKRSLKPSR